MKVMIITTGGCLKMVHVRKIAVGESYFESSRRLNRAKFSASSTIIAEELANALLERVNPCGEMSRADRQLGLDAMTASRLLASVWVDFLPLVANPT